jgi:hypothetical protein
MQQQEIECRSRTVRFCNSAFSVIFCGSDTAILFLSTLLYITQFVSSLEFKFKTYLSGVRKVHIIDNVLVLLPVSGAKDDAGQVRPAGRIFTLLY